MKGFSQCSMGPIRVFLGFQGSISGLFGFRTPWGLDPLQLDLNLRVEWFRICVPGSFRFARIGSLPVIPADFLTRSPVPAVCSLRQVLTKPSLHAVLTLCTILSARVWVLQDTEVGLGFLKSPFLGNRSSHELVNGLLGL